MVCSLHLPVYMNDVTLVPTERILKEDPELQVSLVRLMQFCRGLTSMLETRKAEHHALAEDPSTKPEQLEASRQEVIRSAEQLSQLIALYRDLRSSIPFERPAGVQSAAS